MIRQRGWLSFFRSIFMHIGRAVTRESSSFFVFQELLILTYSRTQHWTCFQIQIHSLDWPYVLYGTMHKSNVLKECRPIGTLAVRVLVWLFSFSQSNILRSHRSLVSRRAPFLANQGWSVSMAEITGVFHGIIGLSAERITVILGTLFFYLGETGLEGHKIPP